MSGFQVGVDYLRFTIPNIRVDEVVQLFPGTFVQGPTSRYGYTICYGLSGADGRIFIYTGKIQTPYEVHVEVTGGITKTWSYEFLQTISQFVQQHGGHCGRFDVAFDDLESGVTVEQILEAVNQGFVVKRSRKSQIIKEVTDGEGCTGYTLYFGSRVSDSFVRVYDKRLEQKSDVAHWVRWELELKNERSTVFFKLLPHMTPEDFLEFAIGVLRSCIDFRDLEPGMESWDKTRAPLLPWWKSLTQNFRKARLQVVKGLKKKITDVKDWAARSLAPMLAVLVAHPDAGEKWLLDMVTTGPERWKQRHLDLLARIPKKTYVLRPGLT